MTTNESVKWSDLREDIDDGLIFMRKRGEASSPAKHVATTDITRGNGFQRDIKDEVEEQDDLWDEDAEPRVDWPVSSNQVVVRTDNGEPPSPPRSNRVEDKQGWRTVRGLEDIENLYDLGFWDNFWGIFECS